MAVLELWNAFDLVQKVLLCMAVPATLLLVVELVLMLVGLAHGAGDADIGAHTGADGIDMDAPDASGIDIDTPDASGMDMDVSDASGIDMGVPDASGIDMNAPDAVDLDTGHAHIGGIDAHNPDSSLDYGAHMAAHIGGGEHEAQHAHGELRWFTLVGMLSFFAITGWAGLALIDAALPDMLAVVLGVGLGVLAMYLCAVVMRWFGRLGEAGNVSLAGAVGQFAEAYLPIGPERAEGGKVSLTLQGRFLVLDAVTDAARAIPTGARVVIIGLADDSTVLVRPAREA